MKKIILAAVAVFALGSANAQDVKFGVKGGLNMSTTSEDGASSLLAFHLGGFAELKVNDKFAVQPELLYSAQGAKFDGFNYNLNYINVPVMAKYYVADAFSIEAGPQIGFLMSAKVDGVDFKEFCKTTDFGLNLGAGYNLNENMSLGLRYSMGLSEIEKEVAVGDSGSKNSSFQLSFGYKF